MKSIKVNKFAEEIRRFLPDNFFVECIAAWWLHEFHCVIWNEQNGIPRWEVKWIIDDIDNMEEAKIIATNSCEVVNKASVGK